MEVSGQGATMHDGYIFAADTGGMIKGNHVDFFLGTERKNPFPKFVKSNPKASFEAYLIEDKGIQKSLKDLHPPSEIVAEEDIPVIDAVVAGGGNFFAEVIKNDPRYLSPKRVDDIGLLEPVLKARVLKIVAEGKPWDSS